MGPSTVTQSTDALTYLAQIIQLAVAPVFLLAGLAPSSMSAPGAWRRSSTARGSSSPHPESRGEEHDRMIREYGYSTAAAVSSAPQSSPPCLQRC
jgi:hypothetical protein